ncbi:hypothetical protein HMPREF2987_05140 [Streptococcus sp. HMSC067H01]|uniref:DUF4297 family anti-phage-associated protein n=1 Tax=Streptococcus sp. HMSC067H01 TaxID=1739491 RepID=UPI0008BFBE5B|nr:DUF4297 family anti-phage-associated protein [Streptococcus sp. HMSC067H01]OFP43573.1 hypothetical protein HMPREF2987_05140 [Streptococcus sp. HMSC067H01]
MSKSRAAISTIKGYFYQFDKSILEILEQSNETDMVTIEGVEDIDIENSDERNFIQCKYYEKTDFDNSIIRKPIQLMFRHYLENRTDPKDKNFTYRLYGYYNKGHEKLLELTTENLRTYFLDFSKYGVIDESGNSNYQIKNKKGEVIFEETVEDDDIEDFKNHLFIDIKADSYENQIEKIKSKIQNDLSDYSEEDIELIYFNALKIIKDLACEHNIEKRQISKKEFWDRIKTKNYYFERWMSELLEWKNYKKIIHKKYFPRVSNLSPAHRFFLLDCQGESVNNVKNVISEISRKYSRLIHQFSPYVYLYNTLNVDFVTELKEKLYEDGCFFKDGFPFKNSKFRFQEMLIKPDKFNGISVRILEHPINLSIVLQKLVEVERVDQLPINLYIFNKSNQLNLEIGNLDNRDYSKINIRQIIDILDII